ncbi:MAG: hypothetical protein AVDCRST_MAG19-1183, partial [uncultured Thermomicrobiales bacterium]
VDDAGGDFPRRRRRLLEHAAGLHQGQGRAEADREDGDQGAHRGGVRGGAAVPGRERRDGRRGGAQAGVPDARL